MAFEYPNGSHLPLSYAGYNNDDGWFDLRDERNSGKKNLITDYTARLYGYSRSPRRQPYCMMKVSQRHSVWIDGTLYMLLVKNLSPLTLLKCSADSPVVDVEKPAGDKRREPRRILKKFMSVDICLESPDGVVEERRFDVAGVHPLVLVKRKNRWD